MSATNLGRVSIVPKGAYNASTAYKRQDLVTSGNNAYLAIADSTGAAVSDTTKWMLIVNVSAQSDAIDAQAQFVNYNDIKTFTATPASVEIGNSTASVTLAWTFNATPSSLTLNGVSKSVSSTGETVTATDNGTTHQVKYTLATSVGSKEVTFNFYPKVYYGVATIPGTVNSAFVIGLSNGVLAGSRARTFTVDATSGKYIWYAVPTRYGACSFKVGGFDGGFEAAQTVSVTNASGNTENYYVYRSTNPSLGNTTVVVS